MPSTTLKRRRTEEGMRGKAPKKRVKVKKQKHYHSSDDDSEDENFATDAPKEAPKKDFVPVDIGSSADEEEAPAKPVSILKTKIATKNVPEEALADEEVVEPVSEDDDDEDQAQAGAGESDSDASELSDEGSDLSETSTNNPRKVKKRNDPEAFATSISRILSTKLTAQKRSEPILSRSKSAQDTNKEILDIKLTQKANRQVLAEKKAAQEKGHVKDVLGLENSEVSTSAITGAEKALRRTAQKGVIKLFNAVRAAQVKGEMAEKEARAKGVVGMSKREENVKEMSKQGFLEQITNSGVKRKEGSVDL